MKIELTTEFIDAKPVLNELEKNGFDAYFVGGAVRDSILKREIHDIDITTSATPDEIKNVFKVAENYSGEKHGTQLVFLNDKTYEVTTFRIDGEYIDNRRPEQVFFTRNLQEDLARRDFTINALAMDLNGNIYDFFGGLNDLKSKQIKTVGIAENRFSEDALRIIRAYRFASQLNFEIEKITLEQTEAIAPNLKKIAVERIQEEFGKLISGKSSDKALFELEKMNIARFLPGDEKIKNRAVFESFSPVFTDRITAWTNFVYLAGIKDLLDYLKGFKLSNFDISLIQKANQLLKKNDPTNFDLFEAGIDATMVVDNIKNTDFEHRFNNLPVKNKQELQINGNDLQENGVPAGPKIGEILDKLLQAVLGNQIENNKQVMIKEVFKNDLLDLG